jgi:hypothetical protein
MALSNVLGSIDGEIAQLRKARALLTVRTLLVTKKMPGIPRKIVSEVSAPAAEPNRGKKRVRSAEGRKRIS